jgi:hypothetical protein
LLGLLREEVGLAARVLESLEITLEEVRAQLVRSIGEGDEVTSGQIPFTPRAKKVLELGLREALSLGHNYIGTEHILLGLVRETEGVASRILADFDADAEKIRNEIIRMLSGAGRPAATPSGGWARAAPPPPSWEYHLEPWPPAEGTDRVELLNALGAEGWTLGAIAGDEFIFQRAVRPSEPPRQTEPAQVWVRQPGSRPIVPHPAPPRPPAEAPITVDTGITLRDLSQALGLPMPTLIKGLMGLGQMKTATQTLSDDEIEALAALLDVQITIRHP